jgi:NADPH:quinone reductase-like Zn-dependent oxidoreductase
MSTPTTNYGWTIPSDASSVTHLTKKSLEIPKAGSHQVLVRLTAASLNYRDLLIAIRSPAYPGNHVPNLVPCSDGAGVIHAAGPSSKWAGREGTKVILHCNEWLSGDVRNLDLSTSYGGGDVFGMYPPSLIFISQSLLTGDYTCRHVAELESGR